MVLKKQGVNSINFIDNVYKVCFESVFEQNLEKRTYLA